MKRTCVTLLGAVLLVAGCESASKKPVEATRGGTDVRADLPQTPGLAAPKDARLLMRVSAKGDQIYTVKMGTNGKPEWSAATPDAKLFDEKGKEVGVHGKGPSWTLADGGTVVGELPPVKKAVVDPSAVPWLEINAKPGSAMGSMKEVTIIQRVKTTGGVPEAGELNEGNMGKEFRVPYTAEYLFYGAK
jgi:hypothetical protein